MPEFHTMPQTLLYLSKCKICGSNIDGHSNTLRFIALHLLIPSNTFSMGTHENVYCYCHAAIEISGEILSVMLLSFTGMTELNNASESNSATLLHAANTVYHQQNDKI